MKNDATSLVHMDANATVIRITIVCHLFSSMSILLFFGTRHLAGVREREGGGGGYLDMVISMKSLRIRLNNTFTSGIDLCNQC